MSKRYAPARLPLSSKKPKLDIVINSQSKFSDGYLNKSNKYEPKINTGSSNGHQEDVWGDDLDVDAVEECMLVASQLTQQTPDQNVSELPSFTNFRLPQMSSTQVTQQQLNNRREPILKLPEAPKKREEILEMTHIFTAPNTYNVQSSSSAQLNVSLKSSANSFIAKTDAPIYCRPALKCNNIKLNTHNITNFNRQPNSLSNGNHLENGAEELKARLHNVNGSHQLQKELEMLKLENERLKIENGKAMDRFLTKEGEVTFLRSQLATSKATAESLRMERLQLNEKTRMEQDQQLSSAKKQINDLLAQLKFKDLEIINSNDRCRLLESKKIRLAEPQSQRLSDVSQLPLANILNSPKFRPVCVEKRPSKTVSLQTSNCLQIRIDDDNFVEMPLLEAFPKELYEECENEKLRITKHSGNVRGAQDCLNVRSFLPDLYLLSKLSKKQLKTRNITNHLYKIISVTNSLTIEVSKSLKEPSEQLQKHLCKKVNVDALDTNNTIYQAKPWRNEIFVELRRCLAITAVLIMHCPYKKQFVNAEHVQKPGSCSELHHTGSKSILDLLLNILNVLLNILGHLPHDNISFIHEPLLISIAEFSISCFKTSFTPADVLQQIIKTLVFLKPTPKVTHRIADLLEFFSINDVYMELMCVNSRDKLTMDFENGVYTFSTESCFLQVFAVTLETCIPEAYVKQDEYRVLHVLSRQITNFVHNAMTKDLIWTYTKTHCHCLTSIMTSVIVLLHRCVEQYNTRPSKYDADSVFMSSLGRVLQNGIVTLHQLLMRDTEQPNVLLHIGYFGGRLLAVINFVCDMKSELFQDQLHRDLTEQALKDLLFYQSQPYPNEMLPFIENYEMTFDNILNFC